MPKKETKPTKKPQVRTEIRDLPKRKDARLEAQSDKVKGGGVKDHSI